MVIGAILNGVIRGGTQAASNAREAERKREEKRQREAMRRAARRNAKEAGFWMNQKVMVRKINPRVSQGNLLPRLSPLGTSLREEW